MAVERTLAIVKPDAVKKNAIGAAISAAEESGLSVMAIRRVHLSREQAAGFYAVHRDKGFFGELLDFMTEGPVVVICFEGENAIATWRGLLGATNAAEAAEGTLRARFGEDISRNGFHGSDATDTAAFEISHMFAGTELS